MIQFNFNKYEGGRIWLSSIEVPKEKVREFKKWFKQHVPSAKVYIVKDATIITNGKLTNNLPGYISVPTLDDSIMLQIRLRWS